MKTRIICLLLALCHLSQGNKLVGREKSGECPRPSDTVGICSFDPKTNCIQDNDCSGVLKCCSDQCGKTCKTPIPPPPPSTPTEKPGQCPAPSGSVGICSFDPKKNCVGDQDCVNDKKCCSDQCGRICKSPFQVSPIETPPRPPPPPPVPSRGPLDKTGQCPAPSGSVGICSFDPKTNCIQDNDCSGVLKCCSDQCGKTCKTPIPPPPPSTPTEKPGQCPTPSGSVGICSFDPKKNCVGDQDCVNDKKCCSDQCGRICKSPFQVSPIETPPRPPPPPPVPSRGPLDKTGQCPAPSGSVGICSFDPKKNCNGDQDCTGDKICCADQCGRACKSPLKVLAPGQRPPPPPPVPSRGSLDKTGQCSAPSGSVGICSFDPKKNCNGDQDCTGDKICCADNCGRACKSPLKVLAPGQRPPPPPPVPSRGSLDKTGQCPAPSGSVGICKFDPKKNCVGDQDCINDQKCCSDQCGKTCKNAVSASPPGIPPRPPPPPAVPIQNQGQCPAPSESFGICTFDPKKNCSGDQDCQSGFKCCSEQCGRVCKRSV